MDERAYALGGQSSGDEPDAHAGHRADGRDHDHHGDEQAVAELRPEFSPPPPGQGLKQHDHGHQADGHAVADKHMQHGVQGNGHAVAQAGDMQNGEEHYSLSGRGMTRLILSEWADSMWGRGCPLT